MLSYIGVDKEGKEGPASTHPHGKVFEELRSFDADRLCSSFGIGILMKLVSLRLNNPSLD